MSGEGYGKGRERVVFTSKYKQLFIHWDHSRHYNNTNAKNSSAWNLFHIWYLMPILTVIKATKANPEALNLNIVLRGLSGWFLFPVDTQKKFTNSHQLNSSKLDAGQEAAVLLKSGRRGGRVTGTPVGWKHAGTDGQQLEVRPRWQGDIRVVNQWTEPTSSGNPSAGLYLWLMPFLPQSIFVSFKTNNAYIFRKTYWQHFVLHVWQKYEFTDWLGLRNYLESWYLLTMINSSKTCHKYILRTLDIPNISKNTEARSQQIFMPWYDNFVLCSVYIKKERERETPFGSPAVSKS